MYDGAEWGVGEFSAKKQKQGPKSERYTFFPKKKTWKKKTQEKTNFSLSIPTNWFLVSYTICWICYIFYSLA